MSLRLLRFVVASALLTACSAGIDGSVEPDDAGATLPDAGGAADADAALPVPDTDAAVPAEPDVDTIPWEQGPNVGFGVSRKDTHNPLGSNVFIAYAGYQVGASGAEAWATALYRAALREKGVRYLWAVQGPNTPEYTQQEIGNTKIVASLLPLVTASTKFVLVVGHSSGSFVAHELLGQLSGGLDPADVTAGKIVYFDLDGGQSGLTPAAVARLRRAYFVGAKDGATGTTSPNMAAMKALDVKYPGVGGYYESDASASGCNVGATWCVHVTLINSRPHNPADADTLLDYGDFVGRPVSHGYLDAKAAEAALVP